MTRATFVGFRFVLYTVASVGALAFDVTLARSVANGRWQLAKLRAPFIEGTVLPRLLLLFRLHFGLNCARDFYVGAYLVWLSWSLRA